MKKQTKKAISLGLVAVGFLAIGVGILTNCCLLVHLPTALIIIWFMVLIIEED